MSCRSNKERARLALEAMKALGFSRKEAAPVLKSLLKLFDNSWEPIEDESYRALADAILDSRDPSQNNGEQEHSTAAVPPLPDDDHGPFPTPLATIDSSCDLDDQIRIKRPAATTNFTAYCSTDPSPSTMEEHDDTLSIPPLQTRGSSRSRQSTEAIPARKKARQMIDEDFQHAVFLKEPKPEPEMEGIQYNASVPSFQNHQVGNISYPLNISPSSSGAAHPLALLPPDQYTSEISGSEGRTVQGCRTKAVSSSFEEPRNTRMKQPQEQEDALGHKSVLQKPSTSAVKSALEPPSLHTVVASSTTGEVKLSIKCSIDPSNFHMPDLEAVFKMVEDKYRRLHKDIPPNFSISSLLNEICQCLSQMGSRCIGEDNIMADAVDNGRNRHNESMAHENALFMEPTACMNGGSEKDAVREASQSGGSSAAVVQQPHLALSLLRPIHDVSDISKGEEKVRISVVNEFGRDKCPPFFHYTSKNLAFKKAHVNISVAKIGSEDCCADCFGNCLSATCPCAREPGGEFAYTSDGLLRTTFLDECVFMTRFPEKHHKFFCKSCLLERSRTEAPEPCKGHLIRKFIKECWTKCGCNMQCGNRVVQRGMTCNLQVFFTQEGKGWGLRTLDELPKGAFVCEYVGELLTSTELHERTSQNVHNGRCTHPMLLDANWDSKGLLKDEEALCLDATFYGNVGRFINHRCYDANLIEIPVEVETPDHHYYRVAFFTTKKVEAFEELTWDYGINFDDGKHPIEVFECLCGSRYCRGRKHLRKRGKSDGKQTAG